MLHRDCDTNMHEAALTLLEASVFGKCWKISENGFKSCKVDSSCIFECLETLALKGTTHWSTLENARKQQPPLLVYQKLDWRWMKDMLDIHGHPMTSSEAVNLVGLLCQIFVRFSRHFFRVALRSLVTCPLPSASLNPAATALGKFVRASAPTKCNAHLWYGMIWIDDIKINT